MPTDPGKPDFQRVNWGIVEDILTVYKVAWGDGKAHIHEYVEAVNKLDLFQRQYPREYATAAKWFSSLVRK